MKTKPSNHLRVFVFIVAPQWYILEFIISSQAHSGTDFVGLEAVGFTMLSHVDGRISLQAYITQVSVFVNKGSFDKIPWITAQYILNWRRSHNPNCTHPKVA